jgi:hypothetical protein
MPVMIGRGGILLNNRRLIEGDYHLVRGLDSNQASAWSGYIDIRGKSRDSLIELFNWLEAAPAGMVLAAQNGGLLPVRGLAREHYDLDAGTARFNIVFAESAQP